MAKVAVVSGWGLRLLAAFLILTGLLVFVPDLSSRVLVIVMAVLAIAAGVLILIDM